MVNQYTIMGTAYSLIAVGFTKIDDIKLGVSLILVGVLLQILVAVLNKQGINAQSVNNSDENLG